MSTARRFSSQGVRPYADGGLQGVEARAELGHAMSAVSPEAKERARIYNLEYMRRRRAEHPDIVEAIREKSRAKDPAKAAKVHRESVARWRAKNPELAKSINRKARGVPEPTRPCPVQCEVTGCRRRARCADHEHLTGTFRGWICDPCNLAANKHHTPASLRALADYVERHL